MIRSLTANLGWAFIIAGIILIAFVGINVYSIIAAFVGFFLRLIYNSEKYKFFKLLSKELLRTYGKSEFQQKTHTVSLWGWYRGAFDFLVIVILPFLIIPMLDLPWYCNSLIGMVYGLALKPIFTRLDDKDRELVKQMINNVSACGQGKDH